MKITEQDKRTFQKVVDFMQRMDQNGIYSNTATWDSIRQETLEAAKVARTYEETHDILEKALKVAGGKHSFLFVASKSKHYALTPLCKIPLYYSKILCLKQGGDCLFCHRKSLL